MAFTPTDNKGLDDYFINIFMYNGEPFSNESDIYNHVEDAWLSAAKLVHDDTELPESYLCTASSSGEVVSNARDIQAVIQNMKNADNGGGEPLAANPTWRDWLTVENEPAYVPCFKDNVGWQQRAGRL